jgi:tRNA threonylcarbamoyladenosine biosynthesis protein TsaB
VTPVLVLEASGAIATAAVFDGTRCLAHGAAAMRNRERETLLPLALDLLAAARVSPDALSRVVVGDGPGAFTSLRIAAATAKGLVHGTAIGLAAVPSLVLLAAAPSLAAPATPGERRLAVTDAMRGDRFTQPVEWTTAGWAPCADVAIVQAADVATEAARWNAVPVGPLEDEPRRAAPDACAWLAVHPGATRDVSLRDWEPRYGRLAEAQVKWEAAAGHALPMPTAAIDLGDRAS